MKKLFLYQLYRQSKIAFALIVVFTGIYTILFFKKMDMIIFRYNNMFTQPFVNKNSVITYAIKADDQLISITNKPYWKKDFLESSLNTYAHYIKNNKKTFLQQYLQDKFSSTELYPVLLKKLTVDSVISMQFPLWYYTFTADKIVNKNQVKISVWQYEYDFSQISPLLKDSVLLTETYYTVNE